MEVVIGTKLEGFVLQRMLVSGVWVGFGDFEHIVFVGIFE
jgi:hypothetical protein